MNCRFGQLTDKELADKKEICAMHERLINEENDRYRNQYCDWVDRMRANHPEFETIMSIDPQGRVTWVKDEETNYPTQSYKDML